MPAIHNSASMQSMRSMVSRASCGSSGSQSANFAFQQRAIRRGSSTRLSSPAIEAIISASCTTNMHTPPSPMLRTRSVSVRATNHRHLRRRSTKASIGWACSPDLVRLSMPIRRASMASHSRDCAPSWPPQSLTMELPPEVSAFCRSLTFNDNVSAVVLFPGIGSLTGADHRRGDPAAVAVLVVDFPPDAVLLAGGEDHVASVEAAHLRRLGRRRLAHDDGLLDDVALDAGGLAGLLTGRRVLLQVAHQVDEGVEIGRRDHLADVCVGVAAAGRRGEAAPAVAATAGPE